MMFVLVLNSSPEVQAALTPVRERQSFALSPAPLFIPAGQHLLRDDSWCLGLKHSARLMPSARDFPSQRTWPFLAQAQPRLRSYNDHD